MATLQTVQKIGPVLDLFTAAQPEWGVSEVAAAIDVPPIECARLAVESRRHRTAPVPHAWSLPDRMAGDRTRRNPAGHRRRAVLRRAGHREPRRAVRRNQSPRGDGTVARAVRRQGGRYAQHHRAGCTRRRPSRSTLHSGGQGPPGELEENELRRYLAGRQLRRHTPSTITNAGALLDALSVARSAGHAYDLGEAVSEVHCVAAPVRDDMGSVVAAVSMSIPVSRFVPRRVEFTRAVMAAARDVSHAVANTNHATPTTTRDVPESGRPALAS